MSCMHVTYDNFFLIILSLRMILTVLYADKPKLFKTFYLEIVEIFNTNKFVVIYKIQIQIIKSCDLINTFIKLL